MTQIRAETAPKSGKSDSWVRVVLDVPLAGAFDYRSDTLVPVGTRVIVPFGRRTMIGVVIGHPKTPAVNHALIKPVEEILDDIAPLPSDWLRLASFAAQYYQRPLGEVILPALPAALRKVSAYRGPRAGGGPVRRLERRAVSLTESPVALPPAPIPNHEQSQAINTVLGLDSPRTVLLHGVTGSGKTEVYVRLAKKTVQAGRQVLLLVPEINLTPQLEQALRARLSDKTGVAPLAVLHSRLSETERLRAWLQAHKGEASVLLGTRLAVFASMPRLGMIIVDEEHDASYKQQEGLRYSARDLAVWRGHDAQIPVVLGSATPSLESWRHADSGRYVRVSLSHRAKDMAFPHIRMVDTRRQELDHGFSVQALRAIDARLEGNEQVLIFLNRRGYAPVLSCVSCGWVSQCRRCTAYTVLHQGTRRAHLQCHHCGEQRAVPRACPDCGDPDLRPMGRGTQRVEEFVHARFPQARIARIDADSTRRKGSAARLLAKVHAGEVDVLIGTQMVAKGHDFGRLGLVVVLNADTMLFAQDFRAPERLFAQLMQVAGRAGRHSTGAEVLIQTDYPDQAVYQRLLRQDYIGFARQALAEREAIGLPPFAWQALLLAEAAQLELATDFLQAARCLADAPGAGYPGAKHVNLYDPVALRVRRVANIERAQLLIESAHRAALQRFLEAWGPQIAQLAKEHRVRYTLEVDPLEI